jgi:transposase-like protein
MRRITQLLARLARRLSGAIALTGHVMIVYDQCPHCSRRTLCEVSVLHRYARCLECGRRHDEADGPARRGNPRDEDLIAA